MIRVLVVGEEKLNRRGITLGTDWASLGCMVVGEAGNGIEAIEQVKKSSPDLIITSVKMRKMNGIEMLYQLRKNNNDVAVIILTSCNDFYCCQQAIKLEASDYILKPLKTDELEKSVLRIKEKILSKKAKPIVVRKMSNSITLNTRNKYVNKSISYIQENYSDHNINAKAISKSLGISSGHLSRLFKQETGCTVLSYITQCRMHQSIELLTDRRCYKVYEVADLIGYKDATYFSSIFKDIIGVTPSEYQEVVNDFS